MSGLGLDVLRIRGFRHLWAGQAISQFGDYVYALVFLFMVDRLTGNPAMVGYVGAVQAAPYLLLSVVAGVLADRYDRRAIMVASDLASIFLLLLLAAAVIARPEPPLLLIFLVAFGLASVNSLFVPAKNAAIPSLVPPDKVVRANAVSMATQNLMPMLGLALSGSVLGALEALLPGAFFLTAILLNAFTFAISASFLARLPRLRPGPDALRQHPWRQVVEGFRFIGRDPVLTPILALSLLLNLSVSPFMVVYVSANREWFGGQFWTLAVFDFAFLLGLVLGSLAVGRCDVRRVGRSYVVSMALCAATVVLLAWAPFFWPFTLLNFASGVVLPFAQIPVAAYLQIAVPEGFRGRVNAALQMATVAANPLGMGLAGVLLAAVGLQAMFGLMGLGLFVTAAFGALHGPFRRASLPLS